MIVTWQSIFFSAAFVCTFVDACDSIPAGMSWKDATNYDEYHTAHMTCGRADPSGIWTA